jgi:hypothetical protein
MSLATKSNRNLIEQGYAQHQESPMIEAGSATAVRPIEDVIAYRNDRVIGSFMNKFDVSRQEAESIFIETLRWLWYISSTKPSKENPEAHGIDEEIFIIDEMWHTFILVTRDYAKFCNDMFGRFIHHDPGSAGSEAYGADYSLGDAPDREEIIQKTIVRKRAKYLDIYQRLGEDVFVTWYHNYPQAYTVDAIYRLRKR